MSNVKYEFHPQNSSSFCFYSPGEVPEGYVAGGILTAVQGTDEVIVQIRSFSGQEGTIYFDLKKIIKKETLPTLQFVKGGIPVYKMVTIEDTIRIPPHLFSEDLRKVVEDMVHKTFEGTYRKDYGVIVVTDKVEPVGEGIIIHGDGAMYQKVKFDALVFMPVLQEIVDGLVCEVVEFGAFCHIGPIDALVHMSQIMNDFIEVDIDNERLTGKESKKVLTVGSKIRARIVAVSMNELSPRESKIGLTMRQPALGAHEWIEEDRKEKKEEPTEKKKKKGGKKKK